MLMQPDDKEVSLVISEEAEDGLCLASFDNGASRHHAMLLCKPRGAFVQFRLNALAILFDGNRCRRIDDDRKGGVSRKVSKNRDGGQRRIELLSKIDCSAKRTLRFREIIQSDDYLRKHRGTQLREIRLYPISHSSGVAITYFY